MNDKLTRIGRDFKEGREVETYVAAVVSVAFAVLSFFGDLVPADLRWAACMMGIGILVYRSSRREEDGERGATPLPHGVWMYVDLDRPGRTWRVDTTDEDGVLTVLISTSISTRPAP